MIRRRRPHSFCSLRLWSVCHVLAMPFLSISRTHTHTLPMCPPPCLFRGTWGRWWRDTCKSKTVDTCAVATGGRGVIYGERFAHCFLNLQGICSQGSDVCSTYRHTRTSCSDMFRLFEPLLPVQPAAREANSTERKEAKGKKVQRKQKARGCDQNTHTEKLLFFARTHSVMWICLFFRKPNGPPEREKKTQSKEWPICFHRWALIWIIPPKPCECFRRKYFLWMCLRGSAQCKKKTKVGAVYFLCSSVC